jgi:hypothetical protein
MMVRAAVVKDHQEHGGQHNENPVHLSQFEQRAVSADKHFD